MQSLAGKFLLRWVVSALGILFASAAFPSHIQLISDNQAWKVAVVAGLLLAIVNMFLKPILIFLSIPALILSLGLFLLVVNGITILIVSRLYSSLYVSNLGWAIAAGIIVGFVNFVVTRVVEDFEKR
jgi:putative membrane protein